MNILLATKNEHKKEEIKEILSRYHLLTLNDFKEETMPLETEETFEGNAIIKATYFGKKYQIIVIADDSGLMVDALDGKPGVYSKRYSGKGDIENNKKLLKVLKDQKNRTAHFVSVIALYDPKNDVRVFRGSIKGHIHHECLGEQGFGYDGLFIPDGYQKTFGQMNSKEKNAISHRKKALTALKEYIDDLTNHK